MRVVHLPGLTPEGGPLAPAAAQIPSCRNSVVDADLMLVGWREARSHNSSSHFRLFRDPRWILDDTHTGRV